MRYLHRTFQCSEHSEQNMERISQVIRAFCIGFANLKTLVVCDWKIKYFIGCSGTSCFGRSPEKSGSPQLHIPQSTSWKILHLRLHLRMYCIQLLQ
ncbi:hypothetical protein AVEN_120270-1 [Araneus ventricosus]|uniref:Uncharacterized protein n=1 Tax=Araneus ventricosus TaxID=182803 RepID=A0A4Y2U3V3_ARAVE|nr:hypothetical protein AVEN_120270-1 [Araneus ventricosus]